MRPTNIIVITTVLSSLGALGCAGIAAHQRRIEKARSACYRQPPATVYREVYGVLAADHKITRESERRGYVETDWAERSDFQGRWKQKVNAEVLDGDCTRVVFRVEAQVWDEEASDWVGASDVRATENNLYLAVYDRVQRHSTGSGGRAATQAAPAKTAPAPAEPRAKEPPKREAAMGSEGGACYPNRTCNGALTCASGLCVHVEKK